MSETEAVHFKYEITVLGIWLKENTRLQFSYGIPHEVSVTLRPPTAAEQKAGHQCDHAFCTTQTQRKLSLHLHEMFEILVDNRIPAGSEQTDKWSKYLDEDGRIRDNYALPFELLPPPLRDFARQVLTELSNIAAKAIGILRWRCGMQGPHTPIRGRGGGLDWSFDGTNWRSLGSIYLSNVHGYVPATMPDNICDQIVKLLEQKAEEPLGHELLREAWEQKNANPRSALLIGIAAAETSFKEYVGDSAPDARWLIEHLPSPPLIEMLRDYLPTLPVKGRICGQVLPPPPEILETAYPVRGTAE